MINMTRAEKVRRNRRPHRIPLSTRAEGKSLRLTSLNPLLLIPETLVYMSAMSAAMDSIGSNKKTKKATDEDLEMVVRYDTTLFLSLSTIFNLLSRYLPVRMCSMP